MKSLYRNEYVFAGVVVAIATAISFAMFHFFELTNLAMVYLLGTLIVAARGNRGSAALGSTLSVLCFDFFFVPPRFTLTVADIQYVWTFIVMFVAAMVISHLTIRLRLEAKEARQGQERTAMMHAFTQQLAGARGLESVLRVAVDRIAETFGASVNVILPGKDGRLQAKAMSDKSDPTDKEMGVAQWAYDQRKTAGLGTSSIPSEDSLYLPLVGAEKAVGVLKVKPGAEKKPMTADQKMLLDSFAHQIALALEVDRFQEKAKLAEVEAETERMRSSLLSSVSHDLRTPLTAIVGSASALIDKEDIRKGPKGLELLETIQSEGERLSRLVQNLLETTRLESGAVQAKKELYPLEEIIGSAMERLKKPLQDRLVKVDIPADLPALPLDGMLMEQVFINLLENAIRHAPAESPIEISSKTTGESLVISVADHGPGLKEDDLERAFDKFYRDKTSPGAGLGLAICRAIINAHGGRIWVENRTGGGAIFQFTVPLGESHGN